MFQPVSSRQGPSQTSPTAESHRAAGPVQFTEFNLHKMLSLLSRAADSSAFNIIVVVSTCRNFRLKRTSSFIHSVDVETWSLK